MREYVKLALAKATETTREDAFAAYVAWLGSSGGWTADDWPGDDHRKVSDAIREAARYLSPEELQALRRCIDDDAP